MRLADMNAAGTLLLGSNEFGRPTFTFREGALTNVQSTTINWPSCSFVPTLINDRGVIAGRYCGTGLGMLVPVTSPPPLSLAFSVSGRVVTLTWGASIAASEYRIEAGSAPGLADLYSASVGSHLSLTTPAPPGRYYVRVRARDPHGVSAVSNEVVIDVP
jgi:hypothetical protein